MRIVPFQSVLDSWFLVALDHDEAVVRVRRLRNGAEVAAAPLPESMDVGKAELHVSPFRGDIAVVDPSRHEMAVASFGDWTWRRRRLPESYDRIVGIGGDGSVVVADADLHHALVDPRSNEILDLGAPAAIAACAEGFVVVTRASDALCTARRVSFASGRVETRDELSFEAGPPYAMPVGLALSEPGELVTQVFEGDGPPWIAVVARDRAVRRIHRGWFGRDQAIVRDGALYHLPGFGDRELLRLELRDGSAPTSVFGARTAKLVALSPDARLALLRPIDSEGLGESEVLSGSRVGLVHEVADVETGQQLARFALYAGEALSAWLTRGDRAALDRPLGSAP